MVHSKTTPKASHPNPSPPITPFHPHEPSPSSLLPCPSSPFASYSLPPSAPVRRRSVRLLLASRMDVAARPLSDPSPISTDGDCSFPEDPEFQSKISWEPGVPRVSRSDDHDMGLDSSGNEIRDLELADNTDRVEVELFNEMSRGGSDSCQHGSSSRIPGPKSSKAKRKWGLNLDVHLDSFECSGDERSNGFLNLRSGKTIPKRGTDLENPMDKTLEKIECRGKTVESFMDAASIYKDVAGGAKRGRKMRSEDKGNKELHMDGSKSVDTRQSKGNRKGKRKLVGAGEKGDVIENVDEGLICDTRQSKGDRKGKRKLVGAGEKGDVIENVDEGRSCDDFLPNDSQEAGMGLESNSGDRITKVANHLGDNTASRGQEQLINMSIREYGSRRNEYMEHFRDIARANASQYAHFAADEEHDQLTSEAEVENETEDWPGPFSTAMKIIKDRALKSMQTGGASSERSSPVSVKWLPKRNQGKIGARFSIPSLQELCLNVLTKNADAIVSLNNVPDALRHKLSQLLCDCRKMNSHFFELLVSGSPMEIRLRDCSWMTEQQFTESFQMCSTTSLAVLQLDQCGRCLPDYVLCSTLAQAPRHLPRLTTLSLSGACRLSDGGLRSLVSSAPALRSINLSQCSLLTSTSLYILADSLGSLLRELYLDDCQGIDAAQIVPALMKLEHLEVLSVAGIQTVCDDFIKDYIISRGHNMRELVLKDCVDEAIAAFLETMGESLRELSLNNVRKVGPHTALSLASRAKNLLTLDLSWCRNLTDNAVGLIVDCCSSLKLLKLFGCTQITDVFLNGHSNPEIHIIGLKMSPLLRHVKVPNSQQHALHYSSV
ncbi:uncharacterized protein LOC129320099 isoform X2 [Prosopis cineraria]|uniref:uncharacterized protein LOC129320099 isoform X2 n=1 Tax=Prosopis cineraria TaxID=364024 RepID=UPI00240ECBDB|nr:uncharacterized protein LOC129320099 isoform X2 [Prosopis cineraria]